ncbi:helix-turn-helix domain-containing protein [Lysobacter auxotrophicus]|uniref:Helix-turn-helix domain-containing protein n=1 Tax=Lysobacter auxotrophicus TaxID=2992573 RepID=A0ABN6UPA1_9GAMM|nr:helix-turn-helix transcriptional regulator [Lysobacter auxotrophicus]BDU18121.1 helix-turn-helix domain-containing protein [Lysobacter auxotrophicus]
MSNARPTIHRSGARSKVSQEQLAEHAGLSRSSIAKLLALGDEANPTLKTICQLADGLGVPPALLLMRDRDWQVLATAIFEHERLVGYETFRELAERIRKRTDHSPGASVEHGRELALRTDYLQKLPDGTDDLTTSNFEAQAYRIGATCATPPLQHLHAQRTEYVPLLLTLCAAMGANYRD